MNIPGLLPIKEDGSCAHLKNNLCSIWETRPRFCRSELMRPPGMPDEKYEAAVARACKSLQDKYG
jgi:Fe-S-cluster containining protein